MVPEPLSFATATIALISFLVTVRNATSQLIKDHHAGDHETINLFRAAQRLSVLWLRLRWWRHLWNIRSGIPEALFVAYWGDGGSLIGSAHEEIIRRTGRLRQDLWSRREKALRAAGFTEQLALRETEAASSQPSFGSVLEQMRSEESRLKRIAQALFSSELRDKSLDDLEKQYKALEEDSKNFFNMYNPPTKTTDNIASGLFRVFVEEDLDRVASLKQELASAPDYIVNLNMHENPATEVRLTVFDDPEDHVEDFQLQFCVMRINNGLISGEVLSCRSSRNITNPNDYSFFHEAAERYFLDDGRDFHKKRRFRCEDPDYIFRLIRSGERITCRQKDLSLTEEFRRSNVQPMRSLHTRFRRRHRILLAQKLSWYSALFMWTSWFDDLCACRVFCCATDTARSREFFRSSNRVLAGTFRHAEPPACVGTLLEGQHLKRLGILLAEIALGRLVTTGDIDANGRVALSNELIEATGQEWYRDAVLRCLDQDADPQSADTAEFNDFYRQVIVQLEKCCVQLTRN